MEIVSQRFSGWGGISFKFKRMRKAGICWGGGQKKSQTKMDLEIHKNNSENYRHSFGLRFGCWASAFVLHFSFPPRPFRRIHRSHSICEELCFLAILEVAFAAFFAFASLDITASYGVLIKIL